MTRSSPRHTVSSFLVGSFRGINKRIMTETSRTAQQMSWVGLNVSSMAGLIITISDYSVGAIA